LADLSKFLDLRASHPARLPVTFCRPVVLLDGLSTSDEGASVVHAYILIQTEVGKSASVAKEIEQIPGVTQAEDVTGPYDVIVRAEAATVDDLGKMVMSRVQSVDGITRTLTCPVVHF
jgi:DNA-binding Lrp family transcriptional regulator